jgi:hypothetical protein
MVFAAGVSTGRFRGIESLCGSKRDRGVCRV